MILHSLTKTQTAVRLVLFTFVCLLSSGAYAQTAPSSGHGYAQAKSPAEVLEKAGCYKAKLTPDEQQKCQAMRRDLGASSPKSNAETLKDMGCQAGNLSPEKAAECENFRRDAGLSVSNPSCDNLIKEFKEAKTKMKPCQGSCLDEIRTCVGSESESGESALAMAFNVGSCNAMGNSACKLMNAGTAKDYEEQKKSAQERKNAAQEKMADIENEQKTAMTEFKKQAMDLRNAADKEARQQRDAMEKAQQDMQAALKDQDSAVAQALAKIKEQYDKWDQEYIKMRDALRQANDAIVDEEMKMEEICEADAEEKYRAAEAKLLDRVQKETSTVKNQAAATQAGYYKREAKKLRKTLEKNYAGFLADCLAGRGKGKQAKNNITRARQQAARLRARLNDEEARIEKLRIEIKDEYSKLQISAEQNKVQINEQFKKAMENMDADHKQRIARLNEESQLMQEEFSNQQQHFQRRSMMAGNEMNESNNEFYMASMRSNCAMMNGGSMREAAATRRLEALDGIIPAYQTLSSSCESYNACIEEQGKRLPSSSSPSAKAPRAEKCETYQDTNEDIEDALSGFRDGTR